MSMQAAPELHLILDGVVNEAVWSKAAPSSTGASKISCRHTSCVLNDAAQDGFSVQDVLLHEIFEAPVEEGAAFDRTFSPIQTGGGVEAMQHGLQRLHLLPARLQQLVHGESHEDGGQFSLMHRGLQIKQSDRRFLACHAGVPVVSADNLYLMAFSIACCRVHSGQFCSSRRREAGLGAFYQNVDLPHEEQVQWVLFAERKGLKSMSARW